MAAIPLQDSSHFSFEVLGNIAEKLRKAYAGLRPDSELGKVFENMKDKFEKLQNMFADAVVTASYGIKSAASASNQEGRTLNAQRRADRSNIDRDDAIVKYQARDAEYMELAKDPEKNEAKLAELVEQAARNAGYDSPKLYHGTREFGFT